GRDPGHHGAQLATDLLDFRFGIQAATRDDAGCASSVFQNKALGVFTSLNVGKNVAHGFFGFFGNNTRTGHVLAVFGVVRDRVVHVGDTAFVDQVDDQLELVQALEVSHFRSVAGFNQRFETGFDQLDGTASQNSPFAEHVDIGLFSVSGL